MLEVQRPVAPALPQESSTIDIPTSITRSQGAKADGMRVAYRLRPRWRTGSAPFGSLPAWARA